MGDDAHITSSQRRLRKHSNKDALNATSLKMSESMPDLSEENDEMLISRDEFSKKTTAMKLDSVAEAINKLYEKMNQVTKSVEQKIQPVKDAIFGEDEGVLPQMANLVENARGVDSRIQTMMEENVQLRDEVEILKGVVHKLSNQLETANSKINGLVAKSMEDNLIFTGILQDVPKKNPRRQLHQFFNDELGMSDIRDKDLLSVFRLGQPNSNKARAIVAHCTPELRRYIMINAPILKHRRNSNGEKFYINQQLPEAISEKNREIRQTIKDRRGLEENLPQDAKSKFLVKKDKLYVNGQLMRKKIVPPKVQDLFPDEKEQEAISAIKMRFFHTTPEAGSQFKVAVLKTESFNILNKAYVKLFQNYPTADHIAVAAMIKGEEAFQDNSEFGSGFRMLRSIKQAKMENIAVFLIRYYGGSNLGPRRFTIITDLVNAALEKVSTFQRSGHSADSEPSSPSANQNSPTSPERPTEKTAEEEEIDEENQTAPKESD